MPHSSLSMMIWPFWSNIKETQPWVPTLAAAFGEGVADIGRGAVLVVRQRVYDDGGAVGAVAFVCSRLRS